MYNSLFANNLIANVLFMNKLFVKIVGELMFYVFLHRDVLRSQSGSQIVVALRS